MKLKGSFQIGMAIGGGGPDFVRLTIEDELSGCQVANVTLDLESWAKALANRNVTCEFDWPPSPYIGLQSEHKVLLIGHPNAGDYKITDAQLRWAVAPFEVDGWTANIEDFRNHHHYDHATKKYHIAFRRWVPALEPKP